MDPTRENILAGYERARRDLECWLEAATPADLHRSSNGTRWTNEELLFHMVFGYMVVRVLLPLNCWGSRAASVVYDRRRMGRKLERTIAALARRLDRETEATLARSMPFPDRWDPFFSPLMTVNEVYAYPTLHFDFHAKQLSLPPRPDGQGQT